MSKEIHDYDKPGYQAPTLCHRCGKPATKDIEQQFEVEGKERPNRVVTVWFDTEECKTIWVKDNRDRVVRMIE